MQKDISSFGSKKSSKKMVFESILTHFGNLSHKKGFFSNLGQRTMSQIRGAEGNK